MSPKANEGQLARISVLYVNVCQRVCVLYTEPGQHSCSTFSFQKVSLGKHPPLSAESRLDCGYSIHFCVPVYNDMSIISIIHELYEASFSLHFQETRVRDSFRTSFFLCAFQCHVQSKQIENKGDPSNITKWPK